MTVASDRPSFSVIVPVHRGGAALSRCLTALAQLDPAPREVIVVADGADADDIGRAQAAGARIVALDERGGPARARNQGARRAGGDTLFFVDADVLVPPDALARATDELNREPRPDAVIGSYDDEPDDPSFLSQYKNLQHHYVHQGGRTKASTFWGACGVIHKEVFVASGGFDERYYRPCIEDIELGYRLCAAGRRIRLAHGLQVKHMKAWTFSSLLRADLLYRALPWTELILRQRSVPNDLNLNWSGRASALLAPILLLALPAGLWRPAFWLGGLGAAAGLLALNARFYRFLRARRGLGFALRAIPWHWFYHLYSLAGFALALGRHLLRLRGAPWLRPRASGQTADLTAGTR